VHACVHHCYTTTFLLKRHLSFSATKSLNLNVLFLDICYFGLHYLELQVMLWLLLVHFVLLVAQSQWSVNTAQGWHCLLYLQMVNSKSLGLCNHQVALHLNKCLQDKASLYQGEQFFCSFFPLTVWFYSWHLIISLQLFTNQIMGGTICCWLLFYVKENRTRQNPLSFRALHVDLIIK